MRQLEHQACFEFDKAGAKGRWAQRSCVFRCRAWRLGWVSDQSCDGRTGNFPQVLPIFIDFRICLLVDVGCHTKQNHISAEVPDFGIFWDQRRCPWFSCFPHPDAVTGAPLSTTEVISLMVSSSSRLRSAPAGLQRVRRCVQRKCREPCAVKVDGCYWNAAPILQDVQVFDRLTNGRLKGNLRETKFLTIDRVGPWETCGGLCGIEFLEHLVTTSSTLRGTSRSLVMWPASNWRAHGRLAAQRCWDLDRDCRCCHGSDKRSRKHAKTMESAIES